MAKQPELVWSSDGELRVDASFPNGRYTFSLRSGAADLVRDLGYRPGEALPWDLFQTLAVVGDVWLPNTNDDIADDLSVPDTPTWMDDGEATAVADYLTGHRVSAADRERLAALLESSALGDRFSVDELDSNAEWVDRTASLVSDADASGATDRGAAESVTGDRAPDASLLHVGKVTLGRQNMGRTARADDYRDAFARAVDIAIERRVDAVLQTGRLFQSRSPDRETVSDLQTQLKRLQDESIPFYLVCGPKERELRSTVLKSMETSGLLTLIGGRVVEVGDGVTLVGVSADSGPAAAETALGDRRDSGTLVVACGDADMAEPDDLVNSLLDRLPTRPAAVVAGKRTDPVRNGRAGVPLLDPGSTEHALSKSTIDEEPPARGVDEYSFSEGDLRVTRHELDVRPFSTFEFEIDESTTVESIEETIAGHDLEGRAVLARVVGSGPGASQPSREDVQSLLAERTFCARVYDERSVPDDAGETDPEAGVEGDPDRLADAVRDLADNIAALEAAEASDASEMETAALADSYAALSKAKSEIEDLRTAARDELTSRVEPDETVAGEIGAVSSARRERRSVRDLETVESVLGEQGIPIDRVTTEEIDSEKVQDVVEAEDSLAEDDVFEVTESEYVRRREFDPEGGIELDGTGKDEGSANESDIGPHKVYLGDGAPIGDWTPVDGSVVEDEIVPLVNAHSGGDDDETIAVNFGSDVSISGWTDVDASVVREQIVPLVERHRVT